jgi:hypothetical protein
MIAPIFCALSKTLPQQEFQKSGNVCFWMLCRRLEFGGRRD